MPPLPNRVALLIDADNVAAARAADVLDLAAGMGTLQLARAYGDWSRPQLKGWISQAQQLGLVARQETAHSCFKNATDIGMTIDAMDLLHSGRFDSFALATGDGDFTRLAQRIREQGLTVYGIGALPAGPLVKACTRYLRLDPVPGSGAAKPKRPALPDRIILQALETLEPRGGWYHLGAVGSSIRRLHPDFDPKIFGEKQLSTLMSKMPCLEMRTQRGACYIKPRSAP